MVGLNVANAFSRYVLLRSIDGADEILVFAMAWTVFLGAALVTARGGHLTIGLLADSLPPRARTALAAVIALATAALAAFVTVQSVGFLDRLFAIGQRSMALGLPMWIPHASVTVGFALIAAIAAWRGIAALVRLGRGRPDPEAGA
ncbi:MAG: TRAP transporter small permease [Azospirillaceae bacterium]